MNSTRLGSEIMGRCSLSGKQAGSKILSKQRDRSWRQHLFTCCFVLLEGRIIILTVWCLSSQMLSLTATCLASTQGDHKINSEESMKPHDPENASQGQSVLPWYICNSLSTHKRRGLTDPTEHVSRSTRKKNTVIDICLEIISIIELPKVGGGGY